MRYNQEPLIEVKVLNLDSNDHITVLSEDGPLSPYGKKKRRTKERFEQTSNGLLDGYQWRHMQEINLGTSGKDFFDDAMIQTSIYGK